MARPATAKRDTKTDARATRAVRAVRARAG